MYKLYKKSKNSQARTGTLLTKHGRIRTPFFMPIATKGAVKSLLTEEILNLGAQIILSNTYHLYLRPGLAVIKKSGGLHNFMNYQGPILTDSGGYQVFSLAGTKNRRGNLVKIRPSGVEFRSHLDGSRHYFTPRKVLDIQRTLGSDIAMVLDVCSSYPVTKKQAQKDMELTLKWAKQSQEYIEKNFIPPLIQRLSKLESSSFSPASSGESSSFSPLDKGRLPLFPPLDKGGIKGGYVPLVFAIVQGGTYQDLRIKCAQQLSELNFDGYALGGLAVGENNQAMYKVLDYTVPELPNNKPRYLMGVGRPENIIESVKRGIDMFDCVIPTREARHGRLFIRTKQALKGKFYKTINITNSKFKASQVPINSHSLKNYSLSYLHHLFRNQEPLALHLATINNLDFYLRLFADIRKAVNRGRL